jgi:hypothetical protein
MSPGAAEWEARLEGRASPQHYYPETGNHEEADTAHRNARNGQRVENASRVQAVSGAPEWQVPQ